MKSRHLLVNEYKQILDEMIQKMMNSNQEEIEFHKQFLENLPNVEKDEHIIIDGVEKDNKLDLYIYRPKNLKNKKTPVIYYMHGGGYLIGNATMYGTTFSYLANKHNATVISIEYRLSTKAPYPADLNDAYSGLKYIYHNADKLNIDKNNIIIMGESAGGGLTARLGLYNKDHDKIPIKGQVLIYPMLDYRTGGNNDIYKNEYAGEYIWTKELNQIGWTSLKKDQIIPEKEMLYYSPAMASVEELKGLPDTFIIVGGLDLFVNECFDYANKLIQAGIPTEFFCEPGVVHAYDLLLNKSPQAARFIELRDNAVEKMFNKK
jgi:acetyl esterase/lipase